MSPSTHPLWFLLALTATGCCHRSSPRSVMVNAKGAGENITNMNLMKPHPNNKNIELISDDLKSDMAKKLIPDDKVADSLRQEIRSSISDLKNHYHHHEITANNYDDSQWEEKMFLDGCFVLYFIFCIRYDRIEDLGGLQKYKIDADLFLLENQLPFKVLGILSRKDEDLLELVFEYIEFHKISNELGWNFLYFNPFEPLHLLDCLRVAMIGRATEPKKQQSTAGTEGTVLRNAKELTAKGIHLKPNWSGFLKDIFFRSHFVYGTLRLPRIIVDSWTRSTFLNLIAYEMCTDRSTVTSYICFLDSLVNHGEDIKELHSAGIVINLLQTDEEGGKLFNEMAENLRPESDAYMEVKRKIHIHSFFEHKTKANIASFLGS